ncbi:lipoprotein, putative [Pseudooceanicola batsensis HTCC2597]|uniref:Lipoprotein, putative n=1 Tax=Pseudooceanicola batsensis (strain ATCC BAA-863 / DSM 15984 / KCTC 12145 / HTCC2597) TaxID=252305 RepID=A3TVI8_PSEBH|nr:hypothetical protein [Pseudooceanicola batsensis]EAQ04534.1 lipoprotein, putative [Pseudooceanicola batsensis HTCC2597]
MDRLIPIFLLILLGACDAAPTGFRGVPPSRHVVEGSQFSVYRKGGLAQAVRTNRQFAPRIGPLAGRAAVAIQQATGCRVTELAGDAAVLVGRLRCDAPVARACEVDAELRGRRGMRLPVVRRCAG